MSSAAEELPSGPQDIAAVLSTAKDNLYPNYRQPPMLLVRGDGVWLFDEAGKRYLDLFAGIAVSTLGHAHPRLVAAIRQQADRVLHLSNYYYNEPNVRLAARLNALSGMSRVFFCNSGTEAIEAMLKLARRHFYGKGQTDRHRVIAFERSFHGRTLGALAATGQPKYREGFGPLSVVTHVPYGDTAAVRAAMGDDVCAVLVEPVQGEGGVVPAPEKFLADLRDITTAAGALLLGDEIQTGVGRTGSFLGFQQVGVEPDAIALAKGLAGGVPIGAMLCRESLADALPPGTHGTTFGGSPLASAAALAVLDVMTEDKLMQRARTVGAHLGAGLDALAKRYPDLITEARGVGLMRALGLQERVDARALFADIRARGVLVTLAGGQALRFTPPLIINEAQIDEGLAVVDQALTALAGGAS